MIQKKQILKSASLISVITIASRILGYLRDQRLTLLLGTSGLADSFVLAFRIPNVLRRLVNEGSMTASFIPVFTEYQHERSPEQAWEFANRLFWTAAVVLAALSVLGVIFAPAIVHFFALGGKADVAAGAVGLTRIMFPYIFFIGLASLAMAILNCLHVFGPPAATPILLNLSFILFSTGLVWRQFHSPAIALSVGVLAGGVLQLAFQIPQLVRRGMNFKFGISLRDPGVRRVAALMLPGFVGIGIGQINLLIDTIFTNAKVMPEGSLMSLYVADRVTELVLGSYAFAVATAILPMMSRHAVGGDFESVKKTMAFALRIVSFITIPAAVGLIVLREPIVAVLFQLGHFVAESTRLAARALLYYSLGLPAFAAVKLVVPAFYSAQDTTTPVRIAVTALVLNLILNVIFLHYFFSKFKNGSPAFATALAGYWNVGALCVMFRVRFGRFGARGIAASMAKVALCSALMGALCWMGLRFSHFLEIQRLLPRLTVFGSLIGGAVLAYLGLAWLFRCHEMREVYGLITRAEPGGVAAAG